MKNINYLRNFFPVLLIVIIIAAICTSCNTKAKDEDNKGSFTNPSSAIQEPPLQEADKNIATPNFLNEEQKLLYKRAKSTASFMFIGRANINSYPLLPSQKQDTTIDTVEINNITYSVSKGRYRNWDEFNAMMLSIYTKEYFDKINYNDEKPLFCSYEGKLCFLDSDRGTNINISTKPDGFELIRKTDDTIQFNVIGYYLEEDGKENWEERRNKGNYNITKKYPITLTKTKDGWRFSAFNITI